MKKFFLSMFILLFAVPSFAAWTVTVEYDNGYSWKDGSQMLVYKISATSDASSSGDVKLSTYLMTQYGSQTGKFYHDLMKGGTLYAVEYVPDGTDTPSTAGDITIDTASGTIVFAESVGTANTGEMFDGDVDVGVLPPLTDFIFACTTLANTKKAVFYIWILK